MNSISVLILFAAILIVAGIMLFFIVTSSGNKSLNKDKFRSKWLKIENSLKRDETSSYHLAILNADKLVDLALKDLNINGETMGERMKAASERFTNNNTLWSAHKIRNKIAHEDDIKVSYSDTKRALASFKRALKDLGAI